MRGWMFLNLRQRRADEAKMASDTRVTPIKLLPTALTYSVVGNRAATRMAPGRAFLRAKRAAVTPFMHEAGVHEPIRTS